MHINNIILLIALLFPFSINNSIIGTSSNNRLNGQVNYKINEINFTLNSTNPSFTIYKSNSTIQAYQVNISLFLFEGEVVFDYGPANSVDYPCCTQKTYSGMNNYSINLRFYLNLSLPIDYYQNGTKYYSVEKASGSFSISSVLLIANQINQNLNLFQNLYLWIKYFFPFIIIGLILAIVIFLFIRKSASK